MCESCVRIMYIVSSVNHFHKCCIFPSHGQVFLYSPAPCAFGKKCGAVEIDLRVIYLLKLAKQKRRCANIGVKEKKGVAIYSILLYLAALEKY